MGCCRSGAKYDANALEEEDRGNVHGPADQATGPNVATQTVTNQAPANVYISPQPRPPDIGERIGERKEPSKGEVLRIKAAVNRALLHGKAHEFNQAYALLEELPKCKEVLTAYEVLRLCEVHHKDDQTEGGLMERY